MSHCPRQTRMQLCPFSWGCTILMSKTATCFRSSRHLETLRDSSLFWILPCSFLVLLSHAKAFRRRTDGLIPHLRTRFRNPHICPSSYVERRGKISTWWVNNEPQGKPFLLAIYISVTTNNQPSFVLTDVLLLITFPFEYWSRVQHLFINGPLNFF